MIACAKLQQGSVSPSSLPEHGGCESSGGIDTALRAMTVAVNVKSFRHLSPSIASSEIFRRCSDVAQKLPQLRKSGGSL